MQFVLCGKMYDTETADEILSVQELGVGTATLYCSPKGQFFVVKPDALDDPKACLLDENAARKWLDNHTAPPSAHEAAGFEIEEG